MASSRREGCVPGTYLLEATPSPDGPDDRGLGYERGFAVVTIKDADVSGVVITTAPGVTVRGRVRFDESLAGVVEARRSSWCRRRWP